MNNFTDLENFSANDIVNLSRSRSCVYIQISSFWALDLRPLMIYSNPAIDYLEQ